MDTAADDNLFTVESPHFISLMKFIVCDLTQYTEWKCPTWLSCESNTEIQDISEKTVIKAVDAVHSFSGLVSCCKFYFLDCSFLSYFWI